MTLREQMLHLARQSKSAAHALVALTSDQKNQCLRAMADALSDQKAAILEANAIDIQAGKETGLTPALLDRLELNDKRFKDMVEGVRKVADLPDPVGRILDTRVLHNGLKLEKVSVPLGVVVIIYESRPNVTVDAASLCFKSGNATILRGGKEALNSNRILGRIMIQAAKHCMPDFPEYAIQVVPVTDRQAIPELLSFTEYIDLCMPRGGEGLIRAVADCSKVPVIKHYKGVCHVYVDRFADPDMAEAIVLNAKTQRPGVCNAVENLLVDRALPPETLTRLARSLRSKGVELRVDSACMEALKDFIEDLKPAVDADWDEEYLDLILAVKQVNGINEAVEFINRHGSGHSDSIVTSNETHARRFIEAVDSAAVYWNASTRFTDGSEFGMGAEIGISTDKIGARGPMGLEELTTYKWIGTGSGQIR